MTPASFPKIIMTCQIIEMVLMGSHNICFCRDRRKIIFELSLLPPLILSSVPLLSGVHSSKKDFAHRRAEFSFNSGCLLRRKANSRIIVSSEIIYSFILCNTFYKKYFEKYFDNYTDGWMACNFTSFSTLFQLYHDDGRLIMKGSSVYG